MTTADDANIAYRTRVGRLRAVGEPDVSLTALLQELGTTPDQAVGVLEAEDCRGPAQNDCFCPVAVYLARHTGRAASATTNICALGSFTFDDQGHIATFVGEQWARTPAPVAEVIARFDHGEYPQLHET